MLLGIGATARQTSGWRSRSEAQRRNEGDRIAESPLQGELAQYQMLEKSPMYGKIKEVISLGTRLVFLG
jgi:hypothetical protein